MSNLPVVIVGAGVGGLATAIRLQNRGIPTVLLDRNPKPGGKLNLHEEGGYRFDTGPSLITMPEVFDDLFASAGLDFRSLGVVPLHPYCRYFFPDGSMLETSDSMSAMSRRLLEQAPADVEAFFGFLAKAAKWYRMSIDEVIAGPPLEWKNLRKSKLNPIEFFRMRPFERLDSLIERTFQDERIRRIVRLVGLYTGCAPSRTPAIFSLIPFLEFGLGRFYLWGGLYKIARTLTSRYVERGGTFKSECLVTDIRFEKGRAVAARCADGEEIAGSHFVVNADPALAAATFLRNAPGATSLVKRLGKLRPSTSAFVLMIGTKVEETKLIHHNILFSRDEKKEWSEIFDQGIPPTDPTVYLNHPSYSDPLIAPLGRAALFAMVNVPASGAAFDWAANREAYIDRTLGAIEKRHGIAVRQHADVIASRTPLDFQERTFADRGSLYGRAPESFRAMLGRPRNREKGFDGVTFVGGATHPGAGIPLAALSGKLVTEMVAAEIES